MIVKLLKHYSLRYHLLLESVFKYYDDFTN